MDYEKKIKNALSDKSVPFEVQAWLEEQFPALKESEDEEIREALLEHINGIESWEYFLGISKEQMIAWLEKQGEKRSKLVEFDLNANDSDLQEATYFIPKGFHAEIDGDKVVIKKGEKPTAWSEEDDEMYNDLSDTYFYNDEDYPEETYKLMLKRVLDWMTKRAKSLRPQSTWKPSDEQMNALRYVTNFDYGGYKATLVSLYEQLKKLRGE